MHADLHIVLNAQEVQVHDDRLGGMPLQVLDDRLVLVLAHLDLQDVRVERLMRDAVQHFVVVETQLHRAFTSPVQDARHLAQATQAAARTFPLIAPELGAQIETDSHFHHSITVTKPTPRPGLDSMPGGFRPAGKTQSTYRDETDSSSL